MTQKNLYDILGVTSFASTEELKGAYRNLVKRYHPDKYPAYLQKVWANQKMQEINEAYAVLRDSQHRRQYDESRAASFSAPERSPADRSPRASHSRAPRKNHESPQASAARSKILDRWLDRSFFRLLFGGWFVTWAIFLFFTFRDSHNVVNAGPASNVAGIVFIAFYSGFAAFVVWLFMSALLWQFVSGAFEHASNFYAKLNLTPPRPWRDLGIRLALLAVVVVPILYFAGRYRVFGTPVLLVLLSFVPWSLFVVLWTTMFLAEIVALLLYISRGGKVAKATEMMAGD